MHKHAFEFNMDMQHVWCTFLCLVISFVNIRTWKLCAVFGILIGVVMKSTVFGDMTCLVWWKSNEVTDESVASIFRVSDREDMFLRNVGWLPPNYTAIPEDRTLRMKCTHNLNIRVHTFSSLCGGRSVSNTLKIKICRSTCFCLLLEEREWGWVKR
jgi:hypothetical protein